MPRYFFHIQEDDAKTDEIGVELPGFAAAQDEAIRTMAEMLKERANARSKALRMLVTDEEGLMLLLVDLSVLVAPGVLRRMHS